MSTVLGSRQSDEEEPTRFLIGTKIQQAVQSIMSRPGEVMAAVSYWRMVGRERSGLIHKRDPQSARIICNLDHVACDPFAIEGLLDHEILVTTLPGLHAKVWLSGDDVIVGSANASGAALPTDIHDRQANIEAAFKVHNREQAREVREWFEDRWKEAREISDTDLELAKKRWKDAQAGKRHTPPAPWSAAGESVDVGSPELKKWLIARAAEMALEMNGEGEFDRDFILNVVRRCKQNDEWREGYARFVGGDVDAPKNPWKRKINPDLDKQIREAVGAERVMTPAGNARRKSVRGPDIIGKYTLLEFPNDGTAAPG